MRRAMTANLSAAVPGQGAARTMALNTTSGRFCPAISVTIFKERMTIRIHRGDLPDLAHYTSVRSIAIDTETMGLSLTRDRLCLVQLSPGDGSADVVQIAAQSPDAPNLKRLLTDPN